MWSYQLAPDREPPSLPDPKKWKLTSDNHVIILESCPNCGVTAEWFGFIKHWWDDNIHTWRGAGTIYTISHLGPCERLS